MDRINLYIDFDGVILDTNTPIYRELEKIESLNDEKILEFFEQYPWEKLLSDDLIINDSINCLKKIIKSDKFNLAILTHVNSLNEAIAKINYLRQHFKDITIIPCPKIISKTKMVHTKNAVLVDDYAGNLREWKSEDGIPVRFSKKKNGKGFKVISKLDELLEMF